VKPPSLAVESIRELGEPYLRLTVPENWQDGNGHMNVRWYMVIFDDAGDVLHERTGLTPAYHREHTTGTMDLEHHFHFVGEVMPGETVSVYVRYVAKSAKRLHYLMFLVNETRRKLAAIFECINAFVDLKSRRTAPFPEVATERMASEIESHARLDWPPPVCGAMKP
jgi:acyl-CoA thioester hydrolase